MSPSNKPPQEPFTQLQENAAAAHEYLLALIGAGFTRAEGVYIIAKILAAAATSPGSSD
jgi:hypothetical protein